MRDWKRIIEQLSLSFQENEERLRILHELDQQVLDINIGLEQILVSVLTNIVTFSKANFGSFYIHNESELLILTSTAIVPNARPILIDNDLFIQFLKDSAIHFEELKVTKSLFPPLDSETATRIVLPVGHNGRIWGLMTLESPDGSANSPLANSDIHEFLKIVRHQLEIAIRFRTQQRDFEQLSKMQNELFTRELDISESLESLIRNIIFALPDLGPLRIDPVPEIQILFYREGDEYLTIKATSGSEALNTRLFVKDSISGVPVERPELPYYLCDPRREPGRYRSYLGRDEKGRKSKEIRTELVVPLRIDNSIIGVINLESELEDAFKIPHVEAMEYLAGKVSPIINALQKRMEKTQTQSKANVYAMKKFLNRFAGAYNHKMDSPIQNISLKLIGMKEKMELAKGLEEPNISYFVEKLQSCIDSVDSIDRYHHQFSKSLPQYLTFGRYQVNELVTLAIKDLHPQKLKSKENIDITFEPKNAYEVFCSLFLREHIYNLLNNSLYSIRARKKNDRSHKGKIVIETLLQIDEEAQELNKRCRIRIHDNGIGLDANHLAMIPEPFTTKRSGTGFGLSATFQYLRGIGGGLTAKSELGKFFEVNLYLDLYTEEVHGPRETLFEVGNEVE